MAMRSVAKIAILPMQDVLGLGAEATDEPAGPARTATGDGGCVPGRSSRLVWRERLRKLTWTYGRT